MNDEEGREWDGIRSETYIESSYCAGGEERGSTNTSILLLHVNPTNSATTFYLPTVAMSSSTVTCEPY